MDKYERIEKLLAMILLDSMQDRKQSDKAVALHQAGFSAAEIGKLLGTTGNAISVQLQRAGKPKPKSKKKAIKKSNRN